MFLFADLVTDLIQLFTVIAVAVSAWFSYLAKRDAGAAKEEAVKAAPLREKQTEDISILKTDLSATKDHINGMKDELIKAVQGEAKAVGTLEGIEKEQTRLADSVEKIEKTNGDLAAVPTPVQVVNPLPILVQETKKK